MDQIDLIETDMSKIDSHLKNISKLTINNFTIYALISGILLSICGLFIDSMQRINNPSIDQQLLVLSKIAEILLTIGTTVVASVIFFWIYSITAEKTILKEVADDVSKNFQSYFEKMLPQKIFQATIFPTNEYDSCFDAHLYSSQRFWYKGDTANYTTFRLTNLIQQRLRLIGKDIKLLILDPREDQLIMERVVIEGLVPQINQKNYSDQVHLMREKIFTTLVALFDICFQVKIEIGFYKDNMFFRSEIMDYGLFLTYCVGGEYPSTYLFSNKSINYQAFVLDFTQTWESLNTQKFIFNDRSKEKDLKEMLKTLGCSTSIGELRKLKNERFLGHRKKRLQLK